MLKWLQSYGKFGKSFLDNFFFNIVKFIVFSNKSYLQYSTSLLLTEVLHRTQVNGELQVPWVQGVQVGSEEEVGYGGCYC